VDHAPNDNSLKKKSSFFINILSFHPIIIAYESRSAASDSATLALYMRWIYGLFIWGDKRCHCRTT